MRRAARNLFAALALSFSAASALAVYPMQPWRDWQTSESAHFRFHYHDDAAALVPRVAAIAERVHATLSREFDWQPKAKTETVLMDSYDFSNGYTTPYPYNSMMLFMRAGLEAADLDEWLELLITHEYVHVLHLDRVAGFPGVLRRILGRHFLTFPNLFEPTMLTEGIAVHYETRALPQAGRTLRASTDMALRMEVAEGVQPYEQAMFPNITPSPGPYLYGAAFYLFLQTRYGPQAVQKFVARYSRNFLSVFPFVENALYEATGKTLPVLWKEFIAWTGETYGRTLSEIRARGVVEGKRLTREGIAQDSRIAVRGSDVYYIRYDGHSPRKLIRRDLAGFEHEMREVPVLSDFRINDQGVLLMQLGICNGDQALYDLYWLPAKGGWAQRLTHCARYAEAALAEDGSIAALWRQMGREELRLLDAKGQVRATLLSFEPGQGHIESLAFAPDGKRLMLVGRFGSARFTLRELTIEGERITEKRDWLSGEDRIYAPTYRRDGRALFFSSDHGGVINLRQLDFSNDSVQTLTNVEGGAFYPAEDDAGGFYYLGYRTKGLDLYHIESLQLRHEALPQTPKPSLDALPPLPSVQPGAQDSVLTAAHSYSPWRSLAPTSWQPAFNASIDRSEWGASIFGRDALQQHFYSATLMADARYGGATGLAAYNFYRILNIGASSEHTPVMDSSGEKNIGVTREEKAFATLHGTLRGIEASGGVALGYVASKESTDDTGATLKGRLIASSKRDDVVGAGLFFDNARAYRYSVHSMAGRNLQFLAEESTSVSDYHGRVYRLDWSEYFHLGGDHALSLRARFGQGDTQTRPFNLGGARMETSLSTAANIAATPSPFNERNLAFRGYREGEKLLTGTMMQQFTAQWNFPLALIERGGRAPPLRGLFAASLTQVSGALFAESAAVWNKGSSPQKNYDSAGAELYLDFSFLHILQARMTLGAAQGFDRDIGGTQAYALIGSVF